MTITITIEELKADVARLNEKVVAFERAKPRVIAVDEAEVELAEGEIYAGLILNDDELADALHP